MLISEIPTNPSGLKNTNPSAYKKEHSPLRKSFEGELNKNRQLRQAFSRLENQESKASHLDEEVEKNKQIGIKKD